MKDRVLPVALIAVGLIWLLFATGFVPASLGVALGRFWPLLLIGAGLDVWIPERRPLAVYFTAWAAALILVLGIFLSGRGLTGGEHEVNRVLDAGTQRVTFEVHNGSAEANLQTSAQGQTLVYARFTGDPVGTVQVSDGRTSTVRIQPEEPPATIAEPGGDAQRRKAVPREHEGKSPPPERGAHLRRDPTRQAKCGRDLGREAGRVLDAAELDGVTAPLESSRQPAIQ